MKNTRVIRGRGALNLFVLCVLQIMCLGVLAQQPVINVSETDHKEGEIATATVALDSPLNDPITISYDAYRSNNSDLGDFEPVRGKHTLLPGETEFSFQFYIWPDANSEETETVDITVSAFFQDEEIRGYGAVHILDDDAPRYNRAISIEGFKIIDFNAIVDSGSRYVAVGDQGVIYSSTDGNAWIDRGIPNGPSFDSVQFSGGEFLALADSSYVVSTDALQWEVHELPFDKVWVAALSTGSLRIFLSRDGTIATFDSENQSWQEVDIIGAPENVLWESLAWSGARFVANYSGGQAVSPNATDWSVHPFSPNLHSLEWTGSHFIANSVWYVHQSNSGTEWEVIQTTSSSNNFIAAGDEAKNVLVEKTRISIFDRETGSLLTVPRERSSILLSDVVVRGNKAIAVGKSGVVQTFNLTDGTDSVSYVGSKTRLTGCTFGAGQYVVVGDHGTILHTEDPIRWQRSQSPTAHQLFDVIWDGSQYVVAGAYGTILTSPNARIWSPETTGTGYWLRSLDTNGSHYVAAGYGGTVLTSSDAQNWERQTLGVELRLRDVHWTGDEWLLVGENETIYRANSDLTDWASMSGPAADSGEEPLAYHSILFHDGTYYLATSGGSFTSQDASSWTLRSINPATSVIADARGDVHFVEQEPMHPTDYAMASGPDSLVTCGTNGRIDYKRITDPLPVRLPSDVSVREEDGVAHIPITLLEPLDEDLTLSYMGYNNEYWLLATHPENTALGDIDFSRSGTFTIPAGTTEYFLSVAIANDDTVEQEERFYLGLFNAPPGTSFSGGTTAEVTILSDDKLVSAPHDYRTECAEFEPASIKVLPEPMVGLQVIAEGDNDFVVYIDGEYFLTEDGIDLHVIPGLRGAGANMFWTGSGYVGTSRLEYFSFSNANDFTSTALPFTNYGSSVWNGTELVVVSRGTVWKTADGSHWDDETVLVDGEQIGNSFRNFRWSPRLQCYFRTRPLITSKDAVEWASVPLGTYPILGITETDSHIFAHSWTQIFESSDGEVWTDITPSELSQDDRIRGIASDGFNIGFVGENGSLLYRQQQSWFHRNLGVDLTLLSLSHSPLGWRVTTSQSEYSLAILELTSQTLDGRWQASSRTRLRLQDVIWTGSQFITSGENGILLHSATGDDWDWLESGVDWNLRSLAYNQTTIIAVGNGGSTASSGVCLRSLDGGETWSPSQPLPGTPWIYCALWTGDRFLAAGAHGAIYYSTDGDDWQAAESPTEKRIHAMAINPDGVVVAVGELGVALRSLDGGLSWTVSEEGNSREEAVYSHQDGQLNTVVWAGDHFIAGGKRHQLGNILHSPDGEHWTRVNVYIDYTFFDLLHQPNQLSGVTSSRLVYTTNYEGSTWKRDFQYREYYGFNIRAISTSGDKNVIVGDELYIQSQTCEHLPGYALWATQHGLDAQSSAPGAINNPSGIPNMLAYAWRLDPLLGNENFCEPLSIDPKWNHTRIILTEPENALSFLQYELQYSYDMKAWNTFETRAINESWRASPQIENGISTFSFSQSSQPSRVMYRLKVEQE